MWWGSLGLPPNIQWRLGLIFHIQILGVSTLIVKERRLGPGAAFVGLLSDVLACFLFELFSFFHVSKWGDKLMCSEYPIRSHFAYFDRNTEDLVGAIDFNHH